MKIDEENIIRLMMPRDEVSRELTIIIPWLIEKQINFALQKEKAKFNHFS